MNDILLAEDDPNLGSLLQEYLTAKGYTTVLAANGKQAWDTFNKKRFDLCILDVIRASGRNLPIIFLTAKSMKEDAIEGFKAGADDFITKPFSMEELLLRIQAVLRRTQGVKTEAEQKKKFDIGCYVFDAEHQMLEHDKQQQKLTTKEADLLRLLCLHQNDILDRNFALNAIWKSDNYFNGRSMDVYIAKLRKYLKDDPSIEILNVHGRGFKLLVNRN
jgi:DNA-binding response OmpR family regulator